MAASMFELGLHATLTALSTQVSVRRGVWVHVNVRERERERESERERGESSVVISEASWSRLVSFES